MNKETWIAENWRPVAAVIYLVICIFDFILAPTWMFLTRDTTAHLVKTLVGSGLDPSVQAILVTPRPAWIPLTLQGAGMFHIAFGGILGVSAWSRGAEKREMIKSRINYAADAVGSKVTAIIPAAKGIVDTVKAKVDHAADVMLDEDEEKNGVAAQFDNPEAEFDGEPGVDNPDEK